MIQLPTVDTVSHEKHKSVMRTACTGPMDKGVGHVSRDLAVVSFFFSKNTVML